VERSDPNATGCQPERGTCRLLYNVTKIFTMTNSDEESVIVYVTSAAIVHIFSGHPSLKSLNKEELENLIEDLLKNEEPNGNPTQKTTKDGQTSITYYYNDVEIDYRYYRIGIVVDKQSGQVITIKTNQDNY
jgi:hypothetical protein